MAVVRSDQKAGITLKPSYDAQGVTWLVLGKAWHGKAPQGRTAEARPCWSNSGAFSYVWISTPRLKA